MFCTKCGAKMYDDNAEFCSVCGAPLKQDIMSYESETEKINRVIKEIKGEKSVNDLYNDFLKEIKETPQAYEHRNARNDISKNNVQTNQEEWLNEEAINEIWNVPQTQNKSQDEDLLPDGTPDWLDEIKQEEEYEEYRSKFHLMEHPLILTSIVALCMALISILSIVIIWNV